MLNPKNFVTTSNVVSKKVKLPAGEETLYFAPLTSGERMAYIRGISSDDFDSQAEVMAWAVSRSLRYPSGDRFDDEGNEALSLSDARKLNQDALIALSKVISEVNAEPVKK